MALSFNRDFLLLETSLGEKPEGKAASHLQAANCFSCISSRSPERGRLVPGGNVHSTGPPQFGVTWWGALSPWPSPCAPWGTHLAVLPASTAWGNSPFPPWHCPHCWDNPLPSFCPCKGWIQAQGGYSGRSQAHSRFGTCELKLLLKTSLRPPQNGLYWECHGLLQDPGYDPLSCCFQP